MNNVSSERNLVCICFVHSISKEIIEFIEDIKVEYNFDLYLHRLGNRFEEKIGYRRKIYFFIADTKDELKKMLNLSDEVMQKMPGKLVICSKENCKDFIRDFKAEKFINISDRKKRKEMISNFIDHVVNEEKFIEIKKTNLYMNEDLKIGLIKEKSMNPIQELKFKM